MPPSASDVQDNGLIQVDQVLICNVLGQPDILGLV